MNNTSNKSKNVRLYIATINYLIAMSCNKCIRERILTDVINQPILPAIRIPTITTSIIL